MEESQLKVGTWSDSEVDILIEIMNEGIESGLRPISVAPKAALALNRGAQSCYQKFMDETRKMRAKESVGETLDNVVGKYIPKENPTNTIVLKGEVRIPFREVSLDMESNELVIKF